MTSGDSLGGQREDAETRVCATTASGWFWYCSKHDTHGNADSEDEAEVYAEAHHEYFARQRGRDPCDVRLWLRTPPEGL